MNKKLANEALERPDLECYKQKEKLPITVVLDNVRSLANVGSVFRTSDAFLVKEIVLGGITGTPPHREIQRTALGATESVTWQHVVDLNQWVLEQKQKGARIASVEQCEESIELQDLSHSSLRDVSKGEWLVILGNEVSGVDQRLIDLSDIVVEIPQSGTKHSLNVTVAAGIVLWEFYQALR